MPCPHYGSKTTQGQPKRTSLGYPSTCWSSVWWPDIGIRCRRYTDSGYR